MFTGRISRRQWILGTSAATLALARGSAARAGSPFRFRLVETAGLRRFGYPVHTTLPDVPPGTNARLTRDGKAIPAQFRAVVGPDGAPGLALDFNASPAPFATETYEVTFGAGVAPGPEPDRGLTVTEGGGLFRVAGLGPVYEVPTDLGGLLRQVRSDGKDYLRPDSPGFWLRSGEPGVAGEGAPRLALRGKIQRQGPLAVGLRFEGTWALGEPGLGSVPVVADLTFPASKSWVEVVWTVDDRAAGAVRALGLDLNLALAGEPAVVDLGAAGTVYGTPKGSERFRLSGLPGGSWRVEKRSGSDSTLLAAAPGPGGNGPGRPAEGWAHVMDSTRCTALAVADFGRRTADAIEAAGDGTVRLARTYEPGQRTLKVVRAWFHFVGQPVQQTAVTSPQAMLAPLRIETP